jgi:6-phosphogluconolactonase (cycloisomerase 2 family)
MNIHRLAIVLTLTTAACAAPQDSTEETAATGEALSVGDRADGHVYALSNEAAGNAVLVFDRGPTGALNLADRVSTGGRGSDDGLGSEGSLAFSQDRAWLLATNAGSSEVSLLRMEHGMPRVSSVVPSGGDRPVSVTERGGIVYVLNAGARQNITGFRIEHGSLVPIASSTRSLSSDSPVGAAQVAFSPDGSNLVVTEKGTNSVDGFPMQGDTPGAVSITPSVGRTPFGFAFDRRGTLVVSDAFGGAPGAGAVSSYTLDSSGAAHVVTGALATGQGAPCWVVTTNDTRFAYITNTASGTITGVSLEHDGALSALDDGGATASTGEGSKPADLALTHSGRFLYVRNGNATIAGFRVGPAGALSAAASVSGLPAHTAGIVAD